MKYLLLTGLLLINSFAQAKQVTSDLGYSIEVPESWLPLTAPQMKENDNLFDFDKIGSVSPSLLEKVKPIIESGKMDIYFISNDTNNFTDNITENISVVKQAGKIPSAETCAAGEKEMSNLFQREITLYECKQTDIAGNNAFYIEFSGILEGGISMQYHITLSEDTFLMFNATARIEDQKEIRSDLIKALNTMEIK